MGEPRTDDEYSGPHAFGRLEVRYRRKIERLHLLLFLGWIDTWFCFSADRVRIPDLKDHFFRSIVDVCSPLSAPYRQGRLREILGRCMQYLKNHQRQWFLHSLYCNFGAFIKLRPEDSMTLLKIFKEEFGILIFENFLPFQRYCNQVKGQICLLQRRAVILS